MYAQATKARAPDSQRASQNLLKSRTRMVRKASVAFFNTVHPNHQNQQHANEEQDSATFFDDPVFDYPFHDLMVGSNFITYDGFLFQNWVST